MYAELEKRLSSLEDKYTELIETDLTLEPIVVYVLHLVFPQ